MLISFPVLIFSIIFMQGKINVDAMIEKANIVHIIIMNIIFAFSIALHELFHAVSATNGGAFCAEIGYRFDFLVPFAYTTLCGVNEIKLKWRKIQAFYSGIGINAIIAAISLLLMNITTFKDNMFIFLIFGCNFCLILFNCITIVKSDLYHIFCILLNDEKLKEHTLDMLKGKNRVSIGNVTYFIVSCIIQPIAAIILLVIAFGKIGGNLLWIILHLQILSCPTRENL